MEFYTPEEVAKLLRVHIHTVYSYIKRKKLPAVKIGKFYRVERGDLERFIKENQTTTERTARGRKPSLKFPV